MTESIISAQWLAGQIAQPSARGIAATVADLIRHGEIASEVKLPTVRELATELGVSPATVSEAWSILRRHRVLSTQGRRGTTVFGPPSVPHPARTERVGQFGKQLQIDLNLAVPDLALLPDLSEPLTAALANPELNSYQRERITPALEAAVRRDWPFDPEMLLTVGAGYEGMLLACQTQLITGDKVAIEEPTATRLLDILDFIGAEVLPVPCDNEGPRPDALQAALSRKPVTFIYQPRTHTPLGHSVTARRSVELTEVLRPVGTTVIEDDGLGLLSSSSVYSVGTQLPERTLFVRSFSKSHGPDLRLGVIGGSTELVDRIRVLRSFGIGWTSRILQDTLAGLLNSDTAWLTNARLRYRERRTAMLAALAERGVNATGADGLTIWMPVWNEADAMVTLAAHGVSVAPGTRYHSIPGAQPHVRVAITRLDPAMEGYDELVNVLAVAALGPMR